MIARITTGKAVQISSSRVWPCTWAPSTARLRPRLRYFQMKTTSSDSTRTKIAAVKPRIEVVRVLDVNRVRRGGLYRGEASISSCSDACRRERDKHDWNEGQQLRAPAGHSMNVSERARIELPEHVPPAFEVYVGGVRQVPGRDFEVEGRSLVFQRPVAQEGRLGFWRWASMWLGIAGTYRKHETVDIAYEADGRREVETGLEPQPYDSD